MIQDWRGLIRGLVRQTRLEDIQRQVQTEQREREARETAQDITAPVADAVQAARMSVALGSTNVWRRRGRGRPAGMGIVGS